MRCCGTVLLARFPLPPPTFTLERRSVHPPTGVQETCLGWNMPSQTCTYASGGGHACCQSSLTGQPFKQGAAGEHARSLLVGLAVRSWSPPCNPITEGPGIGTVLATSLKCQKSRARGEPVILCEALLQVPRARLFPQFGWTFLCLKLFEILS